MYFVLKVLGFSWLDARDFGLFTFEVYNEFRGSEIIC